MKRLVTAALLSSGLLLAAGAAPAFADPGYGRDSVQRDGDWRGNGRDYDGYRDNYFRDGGSRWSRDGDHHHGFGHRYFKPRYTWERVCERNRWGIKRCTLVRVALPRWY
jgi:hypothetical protein